MVVNDFEATGDSQIHYLSITKIADLQGLCITYSSSIRCFEKESPLVSLKLCSLWG